MSAITQAPAVPARRRRGSARAVRTTLRYVVLVAVLLFAVFPFLWTLAIALTDKTAGGSIYDFPASLFPHALTLNNFVQVYQTFDLGRYVWNSVSITGMTVVGTLVVSALAAYPLARFRFPGRNVIFGVIVATLVLPSETTFIVNTLTLKHLGLLATHLGVVVPTIAGAFGIFVMRQAFLTVPAALLEAARLDGAGELTILTRIMLPLTRPSQAALAIFTLVGTWNAYFWPMLVLSAAPEKVPLSVAVLKLKGQFNYDPFNIAAGSLFMMLPVLIVFLAAQRFFLNNTAGAVK
ncbi:carbohydrate ABC transporter permease [Deinococcus sp.]|uniref:carbohydrate ABC transporter permease n=1 Tax=Deinococcus sp. TaxID=47478 RepID=UPI002869A780|nr:carbohydrate ABC transporter permease [Deinococcus sp.]